MNQAAGMFIGHFAVGFAAKRLAPELSLGSLVGASLLLDLLWPVFLVTGLESVDVDPGNTPVTPLDLHDFPYSHSLLMTLVWSFAAVVFALARRVSSRASLVAGAVVASHWLLDFLAHAPDLPLYPGSETLLGLGLWNSKPATLFVELALFAIGVTAYVRSTNARSRTGTAALAGLVAVLGIIYAGAMFGPPPSSTTPVIAGAFGTVLFVLWAYWVDSRREADPRAYNLQPRDPWPSARPPTTQGSPSAFSRT